jgi:hypothetical protein
LASRALAIRGVVPARLPRLAGSPPGAPLLAAADAGRGTVVLAVLLGAAWAVVVAAVATGAIRRRTHRRPTDPGGHRPFPTSRSTGHWETPLATDGRDPAGRANRGPSGAPVAPAPPRRPRSPIAVVGRTARRLSTARVARPTSGHHGALNDPAGDDGADRRAGWAVLAGIGLLAVAPPLAAVPVVWSVAAPAITARRRQAVAEARLHDQLPDVVDLLALTAGAGLPVGAALVALGDRPGGPLGEALARAGAHVRHGGSTAEALGLLGAAGPATRPLVDALAQHDRYGSPLVPALDRVAIEARARRRRRAEEAARRLPVTLLLPLVLTTFPAFVLLTVIPLLAGSLGSLSLTPT